MSHLPATATKSVSGPVTITKLLNLLSPDHFDAIRAKITMMRESYLCPYTVPDYEGFKIALFEFYAHYQLTFLLGGHR